MPATACTTTEAPYSFLLHGVSWQTYEALLDELAQEHVSLTYDRGELELFSAGATRPDAPGCFLLHGISWKLYDTLVHELAEEHIFMTYDRGELELMSPLHEHEYAKSMFHDWIVFIGEELGLDVHSGGSMTFRREDLVKGLEPDECYWIRNEPAVRDKPRIDLSKDPPPDLAIEIEASRRLLDRERIYAAMGVPELWRFNGVELRILVLQPDGTYCPSNKSLSFPSLPLAEFQRFLRKPVGVPEGEWRRAFRQWVQQWSRSRN